MERGLTGLLAAVLLTAFTSVAVADIATAGQAARGPTSPSPSLTGPPEPSQSPTPSPSVTPPRVVAATSVTVTSPAQSILAGERQTFSGLVSSGGVPLAGVRLNVVRKEGRAWRMVARVGADSTGRWEYTVTPVANATWRTEFAGDATHLAARSPEYSVAIVQVPTPARVASANAFIATRRPWAGWALHDQVTGRWYGSPTFAQVNNAESMIKVWLAADLMLGVQATRRTSLTAYERSLVSRMIRVSDDQAAETVYRRRGGNAVIHRLIRTCGLTETYIGKSGRWSWTKISPRDAVRMGRCVQPGRRLWPVFGNFLLGEMRSVAASNAFGIQQAWPAGNGVRIPVKNGWTAHGATSSWNVTCLGMWGAGNRWVLAVESRYAVRLGLGYGAVTCQETTRRLFR